jgi:FtsH-binding integral membrane protein
MVIALVISLCVGIALNIVFLFLMLHWLWISSVNVVLYGALGMTLSGIYVVIDLIYIMIPGAFDMDDYIFGALMLYADIVRMFIYILMIFGKKK